MNRTKRLLASSAQAVSALFFIACSATAWAQKPASASAVEPSIPYTVQAKDVLIVLSARLLEQPSDWPKVARFNRMKDPNLLSPGQTINIPLQLMKAQPLTGKIVSVFGDVELAGVKAEVGNPVPERSKLQTRANSSTVIELADGSRVTMLPNTLAELVTSRGYATRNAGVSGSSTWFSGLLRLAHGAIDTLASKTTQRAKPLQIETPTALVGVRGTQFRVAFDDPATPSTRTEVLEGAVRADNPTKSSSAIINMGQGALINPAVSEIRVVDLLKAPDLSATSADILKPLALWPMPALPGASAFRVQLAADENFEKIARNFLVSSSADFSSVPNGDWFARIRGIDGNGIEGYDSVKAIRIVQPPPPAPVPRPTQHWSISSDRIDTVNGRHLLQFSQTGLDASHTIVATVTMDAAPYTRISSITASGGTPRVVMDLGNLQPGAVLRLDLTVTQADGIRVSPLAYRFTALSGWGWSEGLVQLVPGTRP